MLTGQHAHTLDSKCRVNFPARLCQELGTHFIITRGLDACLFVYAMEEWHQLAEKLHQLPMSKSASQQQFYFSSGIAISRFFFVGATKVEPDKQGRVLIPEYMRRYAELERDVTIAGVSH